MSATQTPNRVLKQRDWTEAELRAANFHYYDPIRRLVMARVMREARNVEITLEVLSVDAGDIICYHAGDTALPSLDDYDHWPVRRDLFKQTYKPWDDRSWRPNPAEAKLLVYGCRPYYKAIGIWAQRLRTAIWVQSLESPRPVLIPPGRWLCIGSQGEPYHMNEDDFRARYVLDAD